MLDGIIPAHPPYSLTIRGPRRDNPVLGQSTGILRKSPERVKTCPKLAQRVVAF
jgi:hypothetical protein